MAKKPNASYARAATLGITAAVIGGLAALVGALTATRGRPRPATGGTGQPDGTQPQDRGTGATDAAAPQPATLSQPTIPQPQPAPTGDEGHAAPDLAADADFGPGHRAPLAFRPDMDAPMTAAEREALRPPVGTPTLSGGSTTLPGA